MKVFEELLRKTGKFKEEDIKDSAEFVKSFYEMGRKHLDEMCKLPPISELLGLKNN
jgi:hypothetical protein